jgi:hypothetical protein
LIEPEMQERVLSLVSSAAQAMMPLNLLVADPVTDATSYQTWFWVAGILNLPIGASDFLIPALINIESNHKRAQKVEDEAPQANEQAAAVSTD